MGPTVTEIEKPAHLNKPRALEKGCQDAQRSLEMLKRKSWASAGSCDCWGHRGVTQPNVKEGVGDDTEDSEQEVTRKPFIERLAQVKGVLT